MSALLDTFPQDPEPRHEDHPASRPTILHYQTDYSPSQVWLHDFVAGQPDTPGGQAHLVVFWHLFAFCLLVIGAEVLRAALAGGL